MHQNHEEDFADGIFILSNFQLTQKQDNDVSKLQQRLQDFQPQQKCPRCGSIKINLVQIPEDYQHWAKKQCGTCDRFLAWLAKPGNQERRRRQQTQITTLLESSQLNQWEREFLTGLQGKRSLSPRQQEILTQTVAKAGGQD